MKIIVRDTLRLYFPKYYQLYQSLSIERKTQLISSFKIIANQSHHHHQSNERQLNQFHEHQQQLIEQIFPQKMISNRSQRSASLKKQKKLATPSKIEKNKSKELSSCIQTPNIKRNKSQINIASQSKQPFEKQLALNRNKSSKSVNQNLSLLFENQLKKAQWQVIQQNVMKNLTSVENEKFNQIWTLKISGQVEKNIQKHRFYQSTLNINQCIFQIKKMIILCLRHSLPSPSSSNSSRQGNNQFQSQKSLFSLQTNVSQNLYKLSLYLNKQTNKQIFTLYEYILSSSPKNGISYELLSKKLKTDIINISHYCCKLKKMRFIDWEHKKQGIVVFPQINLGQDYHNNINGHKKITQSLGQKLQTVNLKSSPSSFNYSQSFLFHELTLNQNILINVASAGSLLQGGLTNEEIKFKIMKHAENKMVRRTVQGMKNISKNAQRQGKVFEFKYKKQTQRMIKQLDKKRVQSSGIIQLTQSCKQYLNRQYQQIKPFASILPNNQAPTTENNNSLQIISHSQPHSVINSPAQEMLVPNDSGLRDQDLLLSIINTKLTDYISSIGIKQSKRQCTPLKLNRYIYILNYLQQEGPNGQYELRRHIIEVEKQMENTKDNGIIHKRSVIGILQGLKKIQLIQEIDGYYYPKWVEGSSIKKKMLKKNHHYLQDELQDLQASGINMYGIKKNKKQDNSLNQNMVKFNKKQNKANILNEKIKRISKKQHLNQVFTEYFSITFQKAIKRTLRKGFHRIIYAQRKRESIPNFVSQKNLFYLLDNPFSVSKSRVIQEHATTLDSFISEIDIFVESQGKIIQNFPEIQYQIIKYVRRNPNKNSDALRSKYGKNWMQKFQPLEHRNMIKVSEEGYETLQNFQDYLV